MKLLQKIEKNVKHIFGFSTRLKLRKEVALHDLRNLFRWQVTLQMHLF
jgi:hypothetical protein